MVVKLNLSEKNLAPTAVAKRRFRSNRADTNPFIAGIASSEESKKAQSSLLWQWSGKNFTKPPGTDAVVAASHAAHSSGEAVVAASHAASSSGEAVVAASH